LCLFQRINRTTISTKRLAYSRNDTLDKAAARAFGYLFARS
jgi:hypothetical protein